jgi:sugar (pentulose or hexulose) kinase
MSDPILLADFGASRIKSVLWCRRENRSLAARECDAPLLRRGPRGEAEADPEAYWRALEATVGWLLRLSPDVSDLWLCSEMHGFMLADVATAQPMTRYISWQDQRSTHIGSELISTLQLLQPIAPDLMALGGLRLRSGLPIVNLLDLQRNAQLPKRSRFLTLADWLLLRGGESAPRTHPTLAAGTGLYSLAEASWSSKLLGCLGVNTDDLVMTEIAEESSRIGTISLHGRSLRVWGGIGDLQAAAHGSGFPNKASILVNIGTGSQVLAMPSQSVKNVERRLCATGSVAHGVTHIPAGRALNAFASFIDECVQLGGGTPIFWKTFHELDRDEVLNVDASIDLNIFEAAWRFDGGGSISRITEDVFNFRWFMCSLAKSWLMQYSQALSSIIPAHRTNSFVLGGGLSRRAPFIAPVLERLLNQKCIASDSLTGEETLDGLLKLAAGSR